MNYVEIHIGIKSISNSSLRKGKKNYSLTKTITINEKQSTTLYEQFQKSKTKIVRKRS